MRRRVVSSKRLRARGYRQPQRDLCMFPRDAAGTGGSILSLFVASAIFRANAMSLNYWAWGISHARSARTKSRMNDSIGNYLHWRTVMGDRMPDDRVPSCREATSPMGYKSRSIAICSATAKYPIRRSYERRYGMFYDH